VTGGSSQRRSRRAAEGVAIAAVRLLGTRPRRSARSPSTWLRGSSLVSRFRRALRPLLASSNENGSRRTRTHYGSRDARPHRRGPPAAVRQGATLRSRRGRPGSQGSSSPRVPAGARACTATAFRSTRSTSRGRRASSTSRRGSSSSPARSTRTCRTTAARAPRRRSTTARRSLSRARTSWC
jgi:hypothetical protein